MKKKNMFFKMIISSLIRRKSRLFIALLAIMIGATILSGLVTIYYDIPRQLGKEFRSYGANLIIIPTGDNRISESDLDRIKEIIGEKRIVGIAPYKYHTAKINEQPYILAGTDLEGAKKNSPFWYIDGDWIDNSDEGVMIGKEIAKTLNLSIGDTFVVKGVKYKKQAKSSTITTSADENKQRDLTDSNFDKKLEVKAIITTGGKEESFVFININKLSEIIEDENDSNVIECSVEANKEELEVLSERINSELPHILAKSVRRVTQSQDTVLGKLQTLVYFVTIIVLIITLISVYTTMLAMISERKKEIGLKKALGADNKLIIREFIGEGIALGIIGGILGSVLGFVFAQNVSLNVFGRAINFQFGLIPITVVVFVIITVLAAVLPARKIMDIHPAIVLKGE